eukprot:jgi/Botrbrau1/8292/Bobra.0251s0020.1
MSRGFAMNMGPGLLCVFLLASLTFGHGNLQQKSEEVKKTIEDKLQSVEKATKEKVSHLHGKAKSNTPIAHESKLTSSENSQVSAMVKSVSHLQAEMEQSGIAEGLLRSRLETLMEQSKAPQKSSSAAPTCPPPGFNAILPFSPEAYIEHPWYIQKQMPVLYQPPITLFCVAASYKPVNPANISEGLIVTNYANFGSVNGIPYGTGSVTSPISGIQNALFQLRARIPDPSYPSKLSVGPYFPGPIGQLTLGILGLSDVPGFFLGPYWIVAAGPKNSSDPDFKGYDWAIVSGGPPETPSGDACRTGNALPTILQLNGVGYWFFTRAKVAPKETIDEMLKVGASLGFDNSVLLDVQQEGCNYTDFNPSNKP